ncbi:MAG: formate/nitrite transporter family protein, partial [Burkholderiales bacterium]
LSGHGKLNNDAISATAVGIATAKAALPFTQALVSGVLCNSLVCLAVWMTLAGRSVVDKVIVIIFPVTAFVAAGFEHSIANLYFFSFAMLLGAPLGWTDVIRNLVPVVLGNIIGGGVLVALVYHVCYPRWHDAAL